MTWGTSSERARVRAIVLQDATHCALCGEPLDPNAKPRTPRYSTVDHKTPRSRGGNPLDPANGQPAHLLCNQQKGANDW